MKGGDAFWVPNVILKHQSLPCSEHKTDTFKESQPNFVGWDFCCLKDVETVASFVRVAYI